MQFYYRHLKHNQKRKLIIGLEIPLGKTSPTPFSNLLTILSVDQIFLKIC